MSSRYFYVANVLSALVWAPLHVFPGVLVGLAIAFGAHAPELSLAALGVAWSMIKRKTVHVMDRTASPDAAKLGEPSLWNAPESDASSKPTLAKVLARK